MRITILIASVLALACPIRAQQTTPPLERDEVLGRLAAGESASYIAHLVKSYGLSFVPDGEYLNLIRLAGGEGVLLERLSASYPTERHSVGERHEPSIAHLARCAELEQTGANGKAESECKAAVDDDPSDPWRLLALSRCLYREKKSVEAETFARRALSVAPGLIEAEDRINVILPNRDEFVQVERLVAEQLGSGHILFALVRPEGPTEHDLLMPQQAPFQDQEQELIRLTTIAPELALTHVLSANLALADNRKEEAVREMLEAIRLEPANGDFHDLLSRLYGLEGRREDSVAEAREAARAEAANSIRDLQLGRLLEDTDLDGAAEAFVAGLKKEPTDYTLHAELIDVYRKQGNRRGTIAEYRRHLFVSPEPGEIFERSNLADLLEGEGELEAAETECETVIREDTGKIAAVYVYNTLGNVRYDQGRFEESIDFYRTAIAIRPDWEPSHYHLANALIKTQNIDGAIEEFRVAIELDPEEPDARNNLAWLYATSSNPYRNASAALEQAQRAVELSEGRNPAFLDTLAEALLINGQYNEALKTEEKALSFAPGNVEYQRRIAKFRQAASRPR